MSDVQDTNGKFKVGDTLWQVLGYKSWKATVIEVKEVIVTNARGTSRYVYYQCTRGDARFRFWIHPKEDLIFATEEEANDWLAINRKKGE